MSDDHKHCLAIILTFIFLPPVTALYLYYIFTIFKILDSFLS